MARTLQIKTSNGNILNNVNGKFYFFTDKNGKVLRNSSKRVWQWLCSQVGHLNVVKAPEDQEYSEYECLQPWKRIGQDYGGFEADRGSTGGCYGYVFYELRFCGLRIEKTTATADFSFDEMNGIFVKNTESIPIVAIVGKGIFKVGEMQVDQEEMLSYICIN